jgi:L-asparaginase
MDKHVVVVATGGTIANTEHGRVSIETVLADIERTYDVGPKGARISVEDTLREGAETFTPQDWQTIARTVQGAADRPDVDAVLVTHGTYTAEETAYFLHLTIDTTKPLIMVCSQRKHGTVGNDGDKNLLDAVRVATASDTGGCGVLVLLNEEIHSARDVTKTNQRPSGFRSNAYGILGSVEADRVAMYRSPLRRHTHRSAFARHVEKIPQVDIVATYAGAGGEAIEGVLRGGARGLVVNGFSFSGKPHRLQLDALAAAREAGVAVVLTNRGGDGRIPVDSEGGFVRGDNLTAQKARVLLSVALGRSTDPTELQAIFDEY